jgi:hypothetical protein
MKKVTILTLAIIAFTTSVTNAKDIWPNGATTQQVVEQCSFLDGKIYRVTPNKLICIESSTKKEIFLVEWRDAEQAVPGKNIDCNGDWKVFKICQK